MVDLISLATGSFTGPHWLRTFLLVVKLCVKLLRFINEDLHIFPVVSLWTLAYMWIDFLLLNTVSGLLRIDTTILSTFFGMWLLITSLKDLLWINCFSFNRKTVYCTGAHEFSVGDFTTLNAEIVKAFVLRSYLRCFFGSGSQWSAVEWGT